MGTLVLGYPTESIDLDDRTLSHLRGVILSKLRRNEKFALTYRPAKNPSGLCTIWLHPSTPMQFHFDGDGAEKLNPAWIDELARLASSGGGLRITPEPS